MGRALDGKRDYVGVKSILYVELITQNAESWIARGGGQSSTSCGIISQELSRWFEYERIWTKACTALPMN